MIKNILYIAILLTVFVVSWIASSIYHNLATSTIPETSQIQITPIVGRFDTQTVEALQNRSKVNVNLNEKSLLDTGPTSNNPTQTPIPETQNETVSSTSAEQ